jgi:DNA-binding GntR family transcriptional regulator
MNLVRPKSLKDMVIEELRTRIIDDRIGLGDALSENTLAAELGISKTPVREALMQLKADGLVEIHPQRGTFVFRLAPELVTSICELRELIEIAAIEMALARRRDALIEAMSTLFDAMWAAYEAGDTAGYRNLDSQYHEAMVAASGNVFMESAYALITFRIQALRSRLSREELLNTQSYSEHQDMLALARAHRVKALQNLLRLHIRNTKLTYLQLLAEMDAQARRVAP